jgi:hypothetical protein
MPDCDPAGARAVCGGAPDSAPPRPPHVARPPGRAAAGAAALLLFVAAALGWFAAACGGVGPADVAFNAAHTLLALAVGGAAHVAWDVLLAVAGALPGAHDGGEAIEGGVSRARAAARPALRPASRRAAGRGPDGPPKVDPSPVCNPAQRRWRPSRTRGTGAAPSPGRRSCGGWAACRGGT